MKMEKEESKGIGLSFIVILAAVLLRLVGLGSASLTLNEAESAMAALHLFEGGGDNLLYGLPTGLIFKMFGDSEFTARLFPALMGVLLAVLPLCLKERLGKRKAILLSLVFTVDPTLLYWSKRADALIPAIAMAAAALTFMLKDRPFAGLFCLLIALSGGDRCIPALIIPAVFSFVYCLINKVDLKKLLPAGLSKHGLILTVGLFILLVVAFGIFPGGIGLFGSGIARSFSAASAWVYPGVAAMLVACVVYLEIGSLLFLYKYITQKRLILVLCFVSGAVCLIFWRGVLALPWIAFLLDIAVVDMVERIADRLKPPYTFAFYTAAGITAGAYAIFYFRLVEMFNLRNGNELVQINWNDSLQTLPITRFWGSVLLTVISIVILALILKILLGFLESGSVRRGILAGFALVCCWGLITNIWNAGGFDREGDHPVDAHLKNTYNVLNGTYTSLTDSTLFDIIEETVLKHGDTTGGTFGYSYISNDTLMEWQLRKWSGIQNNENIHSDLTGIDLILDQSGLSYAENGYGGSTFAWRNTVDWSVFTFQDWGKWLIFGEGTMLPDTPAALWVKGSYIYSAEE